MPKGPRGEKHPADLVGRAVQVAKIATGEIEDTRHAQPKKAIGGRAGGNARAVSVSATKRSRIGRQGARARWGKSK